jgi:hypothetical protein
MKKNELVQFLLSRCLAKEPITKAEVLNSVLKDYQDQVVFGQASEYLQLVFSLEVDPSEHTYILVPSLGLTLSEMLSDGQRLPKAGLLVVILCLIAVEDGHAPEEEIWGALSRMGVCLGKNTSSMGSPGSCSPKCGCRRGTWCTGRCLMMTLLATSSCGVPRAMWRPASLKTWNIWTELVEGVPAPSNPSAKAAREEERGL